MFLFLRSTPAIVPLQVAVSRQDIRDGRHRNPRECPVALAARRAFPNSDVSVCFEITVRQYGRWEETYTIPRYVTVWIQIYDNLPWLHFALPRIKFTPILRSHDYR